MESDFDERVLPYPVFSPGGVAVLWNSRKILKWLYSGYNTAEV